MKEIKSNTEEKWLTAPRQIYHEPLQAVSFEGEGG